MNLEKYLGEVVEFQDPEDMEGDRQEGRVVAVHDQRIVVISPPFIGSEKWIMADWITGTGFE